MVSDCGEVHIDVSKHVMLDLLASIVADPTPLPLWGVLAWAAMMYPMGVMLGSGCCCNKCSGCGAGGVVFTAAAGTNFTIPQNANQQIDGINAGVQITTTGGTGIFTGVTGWSNANGQNSQPFSVDVNGPQANANGERELDVRFNRFTLLGSCAACGALIVPTSDSFGGGLYPAEGLGLNAGVNNAGIVRAGSIYGLPEITAEVPGCEEDETYIATIGIEASSGNLYTITIDAAPLP